MSFFSFKRVERIGVSISDASIEMLQTRLGRNHHIEVTAVSASPLEAGVVERGKVLDLNRLASALKKTYEAAKPSFTTQTIYIALPDSLTYFHMFRLPGSLSDAEVSNALSFQTEEVFPEPAEELASAFVVSARSAEETVVQYAVADREAIGQYVAAVNRAGFSLGGLGLEAQALSRALLAGGRKGKASLVADLGEFTSTLFVRNELGLVATFSTTTAGAALTKAVMEAKDLSRDKAEELKRQTGVGEGADPAVKNALARPLERLGKQIVDIIGWYERMSGHKVDEIVLTGGTSLMPGLEKFMSDLLSAPCPEAHLRLGDTFARATDSEFVKTLKKDKRAMLYAPALGETLEGVDKERTFEFFSAASRRAKRPSSAPAALAAVPRVSGPLFSRAQWKEYLETVPQRQKMIFAGVLLLGAAVILLAAVLWRFQEEAKINEQIEALGSRGTGSLEEVEPFEVTARVGTNPNDSDVTGTIVTANAVRTESVVPANAQMTDGVASGTVRLVNDSTSPQALVATTRLLSESGVLFRLRNDVTVPAQGSAEAEAYADQPGTSGDIGPSRFTIPGLPAARQEEVYAVSDAPMTGGQILTGTLEQADIDAAAERARASVLADLDSVLTAVEGDLALPELTQVTVVESIPDVEIGTSTNAATITVRLSVQTLVISGASLQTFLAAALAEQASVDISEVEDVGRVGYTDLKVISYDADGDRAEVQLTIYGPETNL